jgi:hypothetical protein
VHKDQSTRKDAAPGERPKFVQFSVFVSLEVAPTMLIKDDQHALGKISWVKVVYCGACLEGLRGTCRFCARTMWTQKYHHWGEERVTPPKPVTMSFAAGFSRPNELLIH